MLTLEVEDVDNILPSMCRCSACDWEGEVKDCDSEMWGDWSEDSTYIIDYCPSCASAIGDYYCKSNEELTNATWTLQITTEEKP